MAHGDAQEWKWRGIWRMDSSVSLKDKIWFLCVCHHVSNAVYPSFIFIGKITALLENQQINAQNVFNTEKVTVSIDSIPSHFIHRTMPPPHRPTKKDAIFPSLTMLLGLGLPHAYWPVSTTRFLHVWLEVWSHGFADERMKRLIRRALAEVNQPQLRVNGLVRFYDRSPLNAYHAEKLVHTMYLM